MLPLAPGSTGTAEDFLPGKDNCSLAPLGQTRAYRRLAGHPTAGQATTGLLLRNLN